MRFGLLRFRSPLLTESLLISSPALLRWFTSRCMAPPHYFVHARGARLSACGLPHSDIRGSRVMCTSPRLLAACRVLHRLAAPQASAVDLCLPGHIFLPARSRAAVRDMPNIISFTRGQDLSPRRLPFFPSLVLSKIFSFYIWDGIELNYRPPPYQSGALTN